MEYTNPSEIVKDVSFGNNASSKIIAGVEKLAKAVKSTLIESSPNATVGLFTSKYLQEPPVGKAFNFPL